MTNNTKRIETISVDAVRDCLTKCDFLDQYIPDNDKGPIWDGSVFIYNSSEHTNENFRGKVLVQVKGKTSDVLDKYEIKYNIKTSILNGFLNGGGTILFVVYISKNFENKTIYYADLTPVKLKKILRNSEKNKSVSVALNKLPPNNDEIATIFVNFYENCYKQASFSKSKLFSIEELEKNEKLESLIIPFTGIGNVNKKKFLFRDDLCIYAKIKGIDILQPLEMELKNGNIIENINLNVKVNEEVYYDSYSVIHNSKYDEILIGNSIKIKFCEKTQKKIKFVYEDSNSLRKLVKDLNFLIEAIDAKGFYIDNVFLPFEIDEKDLENFNLNDRKSNLEFYGNCIKVLDKLSCRKDINLKEFKHSDQNIMEILISSLLNNKPVENLKKDLKSLVCIKVCNLLFLLYFEKCDNCDTTYRIYDFKDASLSVFRDNDVSKNYSKYIILKRNDFFKLDNIDYKDIIVSIKNSNINEYSFEKYNELLLELLAAYDLSDNNQLILNCAYELSEVLLNIADKSQKDIALINNLQTIKRMRKLNCDEQNKLIDVLQSNYKDNQIILSIYLLLDNIMIAKSYYNKLNDVQRENYKDYPIFKFYNENDDKTIEEN